MHNYYKIATEVNPNFNKIAFEVNRIIHNRLGRMLSKHGYKGDAFKRIYGRYNYKEINIAGLTLYPIAGITTKPPMNFPKGVNNYSIEGRRKVHEKLKGYSIKLLKYVMESPVRNSTVEYNDNRISLYVGQNGKCGVTGEKLQRHEMDVHHKRPKEKDGTDKYSNLIFICNKVHKLIHATKEETIRKYMNAMQFTDEQLDKINKLRKMVGNCGI
ncbi:HNH endonuclease signature motif containing protein [Clostridium oryzae]